MSHPLLSVRRMRQASLPLKPLLVVTVLLAAVPMQDAMACASCGCTLSKDWLGPQAGSVSGWSVGMSYDYINQNTYRIGTDKISQTQAQAILNPGINPPGSVPGNEVELQTATRTTTLQADYAGEDWGVSIQVPFVDKYHTTLSDGTLAGYDQSQYNTLGDIKIIGKYAGWSEDNSSGITVGVQLPTGQTHENFGISGNPIDPSLQPGTGATSLILGGFTSGMVGKLGWFTQGTWQHTVSNNYGYTPGTAVIVNAGVRYAEMGQRVVPMLQVNLVHRNSDSGVNASYSGVDGSPLTGGNLAYLAPGVAATLGKGVSAYGYVQIPVYENVHGVQLAPRYILSLGLRKNF